MIDNTQEKNIFIFDAAEGMVLSQDIMTSTGHLTAAKDTVLTLDMIAKISEFWNRRLTMKKLSRARISNILTKLLLMALMI